MKTKNLAIIFVIFLLITLASGLTVFLTEEKKQPALNGRTAAIKEKIEPAVNGPVEAAAASSTQNKKIIKPVKNTPSGKAEEIIRPEIINQPAFITEEKKIKAVMIINDFKYEAEIKLGGSAYDFMLLLKQEKKIDFQGKNYSSLGFFAQEINGVKNNPAGKNWVYYVNSRPAQVGVSGYELKNNDVIEWRYEEKSF